jgi:cobalt/nickel transport protein
MRLTVLALALVGILTPASRAHYTMLLPETPSGKKGQAVTFLYLWGHPFEHQLFDAPAPRSLIVLTPEGKQANLTRSLEKFTVPAGSGKTVTAYRFHFTPAVRGDHVFLLRTPPIWMEEDGEFLEDTAKVVLHVQAQKGWDAVVDPGAEFIPLTRPYGLQPGMAFQAQVQTRGEGGGERLPLGGRLVEIEHYNPRPPQQLPPDEQVTRTARTDRAGAVTATLTDPGWWCLTTSRPGGNRPHDGKAYPVRQRSIFWVFVDERTAGP